MANRFSQGALNESLLAEMKKLSADLTRYLREAALTDTASCDAFVAHFETVIARCDEPIYDERAVAFSYTFVHLLDRYRRFWHVLCALLNAGCLPMNEWSIGLLDVGTGPAPSVYAVQDFYSALRRFAGDEGDGELRFGELWVHVVEASGVMEWLMHTLSEVCGRPGPFHADFTDFSHLDPEYAQRAVHELHDQAQYHLSMRFRRALAGPHRRRPTRYNFMIFSNFLTQAADLQVFEGAFQTVFRALRLGGLVVVVGGRGGDYPRVYESVAEIAASCSLVEITDVPREVPCTYATGHPEVDVLKQFYLAIWETLEERGADLSAVPQGLAQEFGNPDAALAGPAAFGLRAFRKGPWPGGSGSGPTKG